MYGFFAEREEAAAVIYLDHAATTPVREEALSAMLPYFSDVYANASSGYTAARKSRAAIDAARASVAAAIGAKRNEIYFTSGGTEADNWAVFGAAGVRGKKRHFITSQIEHHALLHACKALERQGVEVTYLPVDTLGRIDPQVFERAIRPDTFAASVMLANNEVGTIEPVSLLSQIAHERGILMHTDAVQAVGHIPVDVNELGVDLLSISAHKFGGPKGVGALYVRSGIRLENLIYGGAQERSMRAGTENTPAIVGMGKALEQSVHEMSVYSERVMDLRDALQQGLTALDGIRVNGDPANRLPGHLHISIDRANTAMLLMQLDMAGIAASAGSACTSGAAERSHVITAMGLSAEGQADIRFSLGESNTQDEIDETVKVMRRILKR